MSILLILLGGSAVHAGGLSTRHQSSLQLTVDAARTIQTRVGNSYSISGTNVSTEHTPSGENASAVTGGVGILSYDSNGVGSVGSVAVTQSKDVQPQITQQLVQAAHSHSRNHSLKATLLMVLLLLGVI